MAGAAKMLKMSTNALLASLKALSATVRDAERRLGEEDIDDAEAEELGYFVNDLHEALHGLAAEYDARCTQDNSLTPAATLLAYFQRQSPDRDASSRDE
jgi:hypothetical protein